MVSLFRKPERESGRASERLDLNDELRLSANRGQRDRVSEDPILSGGPRQDAGARVIALESHVSGIQDVSLGDVDDIVHAVIED